MHDEYSVDGSIADHDYEIASFDQDEQNRLRVMHQVD